MQCQPICFILVTITLCLFISSSKTLDLPYNVEAPHYFTSFTENFPLAKFLLYPEDHLLSIFPSSFREVQLPADIHNWTNANNFSKRVMNEQHIISFYNSSDVTWEVSMVNEPNKQGAKFEGSFPNGAKFEIEFGINLDNDFDLKIPRGFGDEHCEMRNRYEANCSCDEFRTLKKYTFEFSMVIQDWPFVPLLPEYGWSHLIMSLDFTGGFDLAYYIGLKDISEIVSFDVCDVGKTELRLQKAIVPFAFFSNAIFDGDAAPIWTVLDQSMITPNPDGFTFPFQLLFSKTFNDTMTYDPDFSILLGGRNPDGGADGNGDEEGLSDSNVDNSTMIILVSVLVPVGVLFVIIAAIVVLVFGFRHKRKNKRVLSAVDRMVRGESSASTKSSDSYL
eukprot:TRINITY_DN6620_c0_g1_i1.p1 TRINITY_DN6620_c0_g1~~TRINITY_DN6620_c0_g1_i1.p1  ORF type:complete len:391 (-),score=46.12 TRINITY_DN6620_c0_g1_i1:114-1286(-)